MSKQYHKWCEQAVKRALSGVSGVTFRAYHVDDATEENIAYPVCEIVAEPVDESSPGAGVLFSCRVAIAVATYYDDDKKRTTLSEKAAEVWDALTPSAIDTAMGNISGPASIALGVQGVDWSDMATTQDRNDQRQVRVYTLFLYWDAAQTTTSTTTTTTTTTTTSG